MGGLWLSAPCGRRVLYQSIQPVRAAVIERYIAP
jgi:hypothetical protein